VFGNLLDLLRAGSDETQAAIVTTVRRQQASIVVFDGFQGMRRSLPDEQVPGAFLYELGAKLALLGATTVVAMEGDASEPAIYSELTVSDAIISMRREQVGARTRRVLDVVKVRGTNPVLGSHPYIIDDNGIFLYPRFESTVEPDWTNERAQVGIPEIDAMLGGGLTVGTSSLIAGIPGTGKTLLGVHFALEGALRGEPTLFVSFLENAVQLRAKARMFGMDMEAAEASGALRLLILPPFDIEIDEVMWHICEDIESRGVKRLVVDSVSELERATAGVPQSFSTLSAFVTYLRSKRVTSYLTRDITTAVGPEITFADTPLAMVAENLLFMRLAEYRGQLHRLFSVLKMRFSAHERIIHEYAIRPDQRIEMLGPVPPAEGWLTGVARPLWDKGPPNEPQLQSQTTNAD